MHIVVLILGLAALVAGIAAAGFGLSIKEFSLGSTMLIAGTTAAVGGMVLIGIAAAVRELHRIAVALTSRQPPRFPRPGEPFDPYAPGTFRPGMTPPRAAPMPSPPMSPPPYGSPEGPARPRESKLEAAASAEQVPELTEPAAPSLQPVAQAEAQAEAQTGAQTEAGPPAVPEKSDDIPLSPHEAPRAPTFDTSDWEPEPSREPDAEVESAARHDAAADAVIAPSEPLEPPVERARPTPFDTIWPPAPRYAEAAADVAPPRQVGKAADSAASATPAAEPDMSRPPEDAAAEPATADAGAGDTTADAPHAVSILKSGVVDGMAYTLYSDGSIEAELPSGMIRFESIAELRMHLEKTE